jgi:VIT1/CCC1 family predicted Fe2+/Mn2+ transporter
MAEAETEGAGTRRGERFAFLSRLSVHERATEAMVGLLVALAARGGLQISTEHAAEPVTLALVSLGATFAWAVLDAFFALMAAKGSRLRWSHLTDDRRDPAERGPEWADEALNHTFLRNLEEPSLQRIRQQAIREAALAAPVSPKLTRHDWLTGLAVFTVVLLAGLPPILPILLVPDVEVAAWSSYGVALAMMFGLGAQWGPAHGMGRIRAGLWMLGLGTLMVAIVLLLGG